MTLILCKKCYQPLIEDIGDIPKCILCAGCSSHHSLCKKCRGQRDCTIPEPQEKECLGCTKSIDNNLKEAPIPKCRACDLKDDCILIDLFCKDCLETIHFRTNGLHGFIDTLSKDRQERINLKLRQYVAKRKRQDPFSDSPPNTNDLFPF